MHNARKLKARRLQAMIPEASNSAGARKKRINGMQANNRSKAVAATFRSVAKTSSFGMRFAMTTHDANTTDKHVPV